MLSIGADIGGSHISSCLFEHSTKTLQTESMVVRKIDRMGGPEDILSGWANAILETAKNGSIPLQGVGLAMPGPFDYYNGISKITGVDKFESIYNINVRDELSKRLSVAPERIRFINDASAFTVAETFLGEASRYRKCMGITLGTGMGSAFTDGGRPVITRADTPTGGILFDKLFHGAKADDLFSTRGLIRSYFLRSGNSVHGVHEISERAGSESVARETFTLFGEQLGTFLKPYADQFGTECLVLGGNICKAYEMFSVPLQRALPGVHLYVSAYGEQAAMIGAARLLEDGYYEDIREVLREM